MCIRDQEVLHLISTESGNILSWRLIMKYFLWSFSFKKGTCWFLAKEHAQILVNRLEESLPRKSVVRYTYWLDMTLIG